MQIVMIMPFFVFIVFGIVIFAIIGSVVGQKKRTEAWMALASRIGFQYLGDGGLSIDAYPFKLFKRGRSKRFKNTIRGQIDGFGMTVSTYQYTTSNGKNSSTHYQTICLISNPDLDLPHLLLRREMKLFDWIGQAFGGQDIDFDDDPAFSGMFVLQGNETTARRLFTREVRQFLVQHKDRFMTIEAWQNEIMINLGRRCPAEAYHRLSQFSLQVMERFGGKRKASPAPTSAKPQPIVKPKPAPEPKAIAEPKPEPALPEVPDLVADQPPETPPADAKPDSGGVKIRLQP